MSGGDTGRLTTLLSLHDQAVCINSRRLTNELRTAAPPAWNVSWRITSTICCLVARMVSAARHEHGAAARRCRA
jgi:hypothetical protein